MNVLDTLRAYLATRSRGRFAAADIDPAADVFEKGYVDSLSHVDLLVHIERTYGVRIRDAEFETLRVLERIAAYVERERKP